jgi:SAM-dependent methyltransferase
MTMEWFDLRNISERYMELVNPSSTDKVRKVGRSLRLEPGRRVLDFGCGFAEPLVLWAEQYGISGVGIDVRSEACARAQRKIADRELADRLEIVCGAGADYAFTPGAFDAVTCLGATFVFGGFRPTIRAMREALRPGGRMAIGEPYRLYIDVPAEYAAKNAAFHAEQELLAIVREEGYDLETVVRSDQDDWDRYKSDNWHGLIHWLEENPGHAERAEVIACLREDQEEYLCYERAYLGWAMYVLAPAA